MSNLLAQFPPASDSVLFLSPVRIIVSLLTLTDFPGDSQICCETPPPSGEEHLLDCRLYKKLGLVVNFCKTAFHLMWKSHFGCRRGLVEYLRSLIFHRTSVCPRPPLGGLLCLHCAPYCFTIQFLPDLETQRLAPI